MDWKQQLIAAVASLAIGALTLFGTKALRALATWLDAKGEESKLMKALAALPHMAEAVWSEVWAELEPEARADAADGVISPEEMAAFKAHAVDALKRAMAKHGLETLRAAFGPLLDLVLSKAIGKAQEAATAAAAAQAAPPSPK